MIENLANLFYKSTSLVVHKAYALNIGVDIPGTDSSTITNYCDYINAIYKFALNAGFILAGMMILFSGYIYLTSQGNTTKLGQAKDVMMGAIIGFVILFLAKLIMSTLGLDSKCISK